MKRLKQILSAALCGAMLVGLAGCTTPSKPTTVAGGASESEGVVQSTLSGTIVYYAMWNENEPNAIAIKHAVEMMKKNHPKVVVDIKWIGRSNQQTVGAAIQAGEQIDVFDNMLYQNDPTLFEKLDDLMAMEAYGQPGVTVKDSLLPGSLLANQKMQELANMTDAIYGLPMGPSATAFFYNKDLFAQAGIEKHPTTWDEFLEICEKLKKAGIPAITSDDAYLSLIYSYYTSRLVGQETLLKMMADPKDPAWTDGTFQKVLDAMQNLADMGYYSKAMPTNKYPAGQQEFALSDAAMYLNATWLPGEILDTAGEDFPWGSFNFPEVKDGKEKITVANLGVIPMYVSAKSKNKDAAKEFLRYIASQEVQQIISEGGFAPVTSGTVWPKAIADLESVAKTATDVVLWGANFSGEFVNGAVMPEINKVLTGSSTAEQAMAAIKAAADKY